MAEDEALKAACRRRDEAWEVLRRAQAANEAAEVVYDDAKREVESLLRERHSLSGAGRG